MKGHHRHGHRASSCGPGGYARFSGFGGPRGGWGGWSGWAGFDPQAFGFMGPRGGPRGRRRGRARRGDTRAAILVLLAEEPRNGYQIMQEIEQRSEGAWRPGSGSIYPALQLLEDEGLVRAEETDGRRTYQLTDAGREAVAERGDEPAPWDAVREATAETPGGPVWETLDVARQVGMAVFQLANVGDERQLAAAREILAEARRELYRLLAEPEDDDDTPSSG